ncbi:uncharacterized protein LOC110451599 [Mizuhopecten yessoensis]|uniref:uncharacterized protein LOC110451599 n=1 Tax=Mizuhopecten yessoensis TaxID=6573 RepID=UPI000B4597EE|nr:uncharacterized protein LOC110451599 [Mizuhopecten yessoensis]
MNQPLEHDPIFEIPNDCQREASFRGWSYMHIPIEPLVGGGFTCINPNTSTVACTACGLQADAARLNGTSPYDFHVQRSPGCLFFNPFRHESNRRQSFLYWSGYSGALDIDDLVAAGFYLTEFGQGNIQCFCCGISSSSLSQIVDIRQQHTQLSPHCVFIRNVLSQ